VATLPPWGLAFIVVASFVVGPLLPAPAGFAQEPIFETTTFAPIQPGGMKIALETVATGLTAPMKSVTAPSLPHHLFVPDQAGKLWAINLMTGARTLFLDVSAHLVTLGVCGPNTFDERGLLGVAFHPDFARNGLFFTYTSEPNAGPPTFPSTLPPGIAANHQNVVRKWRKLQSGPAPPVIHDLGELMRVDWPQFNHNGGDMAFGPDDMLYISMGDGGGADDRDDQMFITTLPGCPDAPIVGHGLDGNGQKLTNPLGKILRIDVNGSNSANGKYGIPADNPFVNVPDAINEIYAFGLRNPWRFSFDMGTGALYVGDVGQNDLEEVNRIVKGGNYGWRIKEGTKFFNPNGNDVGYACDPVQGPFPCPASPGSFIDPIAQYDTHTEGHSVIGGHVYRGSRIPALRGRYVFADFTLTFDEVFPGGPFISGRLFYLQQKKTSKDKLLNIQELKVAGKDKLGLSMLGMGQDASGEVYVTANTTGIPFGTSGVVLRIGPVSEADDD
jgi:glucose/arabinose dehydrogenase